MQGSRFLAVLKTDHSYDNNTKGVFLTWPGVGNLTKSNETLSNKPNKPNKANKDLVTSQGGVGGAEWTLFIRERTLWNLNGVLKESNLDVAQFELIPYRHHFYNKRKNK